MSKNLIERIPVEGTANPLKYLISIKVFPNIGRTELYLL